MLVLLCLLYLSIHWLITMNYANYYWLTTSAIYTATSHLQAYLCHIKNRYHSLADYTIFLHTQPAHHLEFERFTRMIIYLWSCQHSNHRINLDYLSLNYRWFEGWWAHQPEMWVVCELMYYYYHYYFYCYYYHYYFYYYYYCLYYYTTTTRTTTTSTTTKYLSNDHSCWR
jgi:hypothetical protein